MGNLGINEKKLLARMICKRAMIVHDGTGHDMFIALANGDRRRRPMAWVDQDMLNRLLSREAVVKRGCAYVVTTQYKRTHLRGEERNASAL